MTVLITLLGVAVLLLGVLVAGLLRSHADVLRALHDLGATEGDLTGADRATMSPRVGRQAGDDDRETAAGKGRHAHDLLGRSPTGAAVAVNVVGATHTTLLAFLTSGCATCRGFWDAFADPGLVLPGPADRLVVVTKSATHESPGVVAELASSRTTVVMSDDAWDHYDVPVAPYFVLVTGPTGSVVGEGSALSWSQVSGLLARAVADGTMSGSPATPDAAMGPDNPSRVDAELAAAGIEPGDPSLYPGADPDAGAEPVSPSGPSTAGAELAHGPD